MHVHIVPLLAFLHMYVCLYVCNQSNQIKSKSNHFNDLNGHSKPFEYLESYLVWIMRVEMARISVSFV